jgi:hypothetical protein
MYINSSIDFPYISDSPLSADTKWVAIPIYVSAKKNGFLRASSAAKEALLDAYNSIKDSNENQIATSLLEFDKKFEELKAIIQLTRIKDSECQADIYNYFIIKFSGDGDFWLKIEHLSKVLDSLYERSSKYRSDKLIQVQIGERYNKGK